MNTPSPRIWVLADDKAGHRNQALGVADAVELPYDIRNLHYTKSASQPNWLKGASLKGIDIEKSDALKAPWPDIIIAAGRRTAPVALWIKKQAKTQQQKCFITQIMWPGKPAHDIDLIATPEHDGIKPSKNIITTLGAPHRVTPSLLKREAAMWHKTLGEPTSPIISLLIGGNSGKHHLTSSHTKTLVNNACTLTQRVKGTLFITNSRRTPEDATQAIYDSLTEFPELDTHFHDVQQTTSRANPYYAFLALADIILVTGDSISMVCEAVASGKPVLLSTSNTLTPPKHQIFHQSLCKAGFASLLSAETLDKVESALKKGDTGNSNALFPAQTVAEAIKNRAL